MSSIFAQKTNRAFNQLILAITAIAGLIFFVFSEIYQTISLYLGLLAHKIIASCGCADMAQFLSVHQTIAGLAVIAGSGAAVFVFYSAGVTSFGNRGQILLVHVHHHPSEVHGVAEDGLH